LDAGHGRTYKLLLAVEYDLNLNSHLLSAEVHRTRSPRSAVGALSAAPLPSLTGISLCDVCSCRHEILPPHKRRLRAVASFRWWGSPN
jgi:hypothetical protein